MMERILESDRKILRDLANKQLEFAHSEQNANILKSGMPWPRANGKRPRCVCCFQILLMRSLRRACAARVKPPEGWNGNC